jgi:hypothetical protein
MNSNPTTRTNRSNYRFAPDKPCNCCGRRFRQAKSKPNDQGETIIDISAAVERQFREHLEKLEAPKRKQLARQRLEERADILHLLHPSRWCSSLSYAEELKLRTIAQLERNQKLEQMTAARSSKSAKAINGVNEVGI